MNKLATTFIKTIKQNLSFILVLFVLFASRSSLADWYVVPTGSMQPTIVEGDRILVNKMAYRLELPFSDITLLNLATPTRGDIVTLNSKAADTRLVKRVIGLPGDHIQLVNNQLIINGQLVSYLNTSLSKQKTEQLAEKSHMVQFLQTSNPMDNFDMVEVPKDSYLLMGDNRNNSADSRVYGFFPAQEIQGKALRVLVSLDPQNNYLPRSERFLKPLI
ncbi:signal peptidase I [Paraglaciecola sp. 25GB23A]|uniref:signal peptidase I n=1 Tax=Paraglaciecola sp. 25GB23A TaxID=3156068 RepID=UPI0032AEC717